MLALDAVTGILDEPHFARTAMRVAVTGNGQEVEPDFDAAARRNVERAGQISGDEKRSLEYAQEHHGLAQIVPRDRFGHPVDPKFDLRGAENDRLNLRHADLRIGVRARA